MRWRSLLSLAVFVVLGYFILRHLGDISELDRALRQGKPAWVLAAICLQLLGLIDTAALYWALYRLLILKISFSNMLPLSLSAQFINFSAPSSGLGGTVVFLNDAKRRGLETSKVVLANFLFTLFNLIWFSIILVFGLFILFIQHQLKLYELLSASLMLVTTLALLLSLILAGLKPSWLRGLITLVVKPINSLTKVLLKRNLMDLEAAQGWVNELSNAVAALRGKQRELIPSILFTMGTDALELAVLYACLKAFLPGFVVLSLGMLIAAYGIGILFSSIAITPQGLGVVEGAMGATLVSLGLPVAEVTLAILSYRGLSFWLPLLVGALATRRVIHSSRGEL